MQIGRCIYLHGFLSSANSHKGQWFQERFVHYLQSERNLSIKDVVAPTYPFASPDKSVGFLRHMIEQAGLSESREPWFVAGSSMGGFYARYLAAIYSVPYIMINPALDPAALFQDYKGSYSNPFTDETVVIDEAYCTQLQNYYVDMPEVPAMLLLDKGDEIIDYRQAHALYTASISKQEWKAERTQKVLVFDGGDHAFQHLEEAKETMADFLEAAFSTADG